MNQPLDLLVSNSRASYYVGGTEVVSLHQAKGLARLGHHVTYVVRKVDTPSEYFQEFTDSIRREQLPIHIGEVATNAPYGDGHSWAIWNQEAAAFGIAAQDVYREAIANGADASVTHMSADSLYIPDAAPHIVHLHGSPKQTDPLIDVSMTRPDAGVAHSTSIEEWWHGNYPDLPMHTFRNGVPIETFYHPVDAERPIDILYVGRFLEHKGIQDILQAASPDQHIVIAGGGSYQPHIEALIRERGLQAEIVERPDNEQLALLYKHSKIFACPSRAKEGVLTTMLEAAAAGCAVVTSHGSGMSDAARHDQNSKLIVPGDVAALTLSFTQLLEDSTKRQQLAGVFQQEICDKWSWETKAKELEAIYETVLSSY